MILFTYRSSLILDKQFAVAHWTGILGGGALNEEDTGSLRSRQLPSGR